MGCNEEVLLLQFKLGDQRAFDQLFKMYAPRLGYFCLKWVNHVDAEEVVQDAFLKVWEAREKIDTGRSFNTYITAIAKNLIYDMFRRRLVEQQYFQQLQKIWKEQSDDENELYVNNLREVMIESINKLSDQQREVMMLKSKGFTNDEIAELLGISKRTVEAHLNKAYRKLRTELCEVKYYLLLFAIILN